MSRIVTVFGATGTQGSSVVREILKDGTFAARAITRDITSQGAKDLISQGAQVVQADTQNEESLKKALEGSEAVFIVTIPFTSIDEKAQATLIINASKAVGVKYVIWSSLPGAKKESNGEIVIEYADDKAEVDDILRASGIPHTILQTGMFLENLWKFVGRHPFDYFKRDDPSGNSYTLTLVRVEDIPQCFSYISRDIGAAVLVLLKSYNDESKKSKVLGQTFHVATEYTTGKDFAAKLSKGLGKPVKFVSLASSGIPILEKAMDFMNKYCKYPQQGIPDRRLVELGVKFSSVEEFVEDNKAKLLAL